MSEQITQQEEKKKSRPWVLWGFLLVALLVVAAFVGGRLLGTQGQINEGGFSVTEAKEMPKEEPVLTGMVSQRDGDNLFVQEFSMNQAMGMGSGGDGGVVIIEMEGPPIGDGDDGEIPVPEFFGTDGPVTEVVVTHDTLVYKDVTFEGEEFDMEIGEGEMPDLPDQIEMKVEVGSIDDIGTNMVVTVWGEENGDRVIAEVIIYQSPMLMGGN
jgi:hypothetical protein